MTDDLTASLTETDRVEQVMANDATDSSTHILPFRCRPDASDDAVIELLRRAIIFTMSPHDFAELPKPLRDSLVVVPRI